MTSLQHTVTKLYFSATHCSTDKLIPDAYNTPEFFIHTTEHVVMEIIGKVEVVVLQLR